MTDQEFKEKIAEKKRERLRAVPCEVYSRVVGYYRPVSQWNEGKKQEFSERTEIDLKTFIGLTSVAKPLEEE